MQISIECGPLGGATVQRDPRSVGIPERLQVSTGRGIRRQSRRAPRDQWLRGGLVVSRHTHHSVRTTLVIDAVDLMGRDIPVIPEIAGYAAIAAAVFDGILLAVYLHLSQVSPVVGWK